MAVLPQRLAEPLRRRWRAELVRRGAAATPQDDLRPCLVLSPHPDDEVLGVGSTILRRTLRGTPVTVVHVSMGERSHPVIPRARLAATRRGEAERAAALLGVQDVRFLELPDGRLAAHQDDIAAAVRDLLAELGPADVLAPAVGEAHPDHAAVALAVRQAVGEAQIPLRLLDYYVWYWSLWPWQRDAGGRLAAVRQELTRPVLVVDGRPVQDRKLNALAAYRSQTVGSAGAGALPAGVLARAADRHELLGLPGPVPAVVGARPGQ
ncbi:MAG: PIG-L deacetylase family protein [Motilibacteraceae bacterium]